MKTIQTKLRIKLSNGHYLDISANTVPVVSGTVQRKACKMRSFDNLDHLVRCLDMSDTIPSETETYPLELLRGKDCYLDIILSENIEILPGLYLLVSKLLTMCTSDVELEFNQTNMLILTYEPI